MTDPLTLVHQHNKAQNCIVWIIDMADDSASCGAIVTHLVDGSFPHFKSNALSVVADPECVSKNNREPWIDSDFFIPLWSSEMSKSQLILLEFHSL